MARLPSRFECIHLLVLFFDVPLKHVTKSNFEFALSELKSHVGAADFVTIDLEMTGVTSAPWRESLEFDRFDVRYLKAKDSAEKFSIIQFSVCPFRRDDHRHSFIAHPHNFFIFPCRELAAGGPSNEFMCQMTSMDFLAQCESELQLGFAIKFLVRAFRG
uniref:Uncharacterized protein n=1 Tax=Manihot esculenta TaxID=3983 RepID=A0A2C9WRP7_MANES